MEFLVLIAAFAIFLLFANYSKQWLSGLPEQKRIKYTLIITSIIYIGLLAFFIKSLVKYFNYLSLIIIILFTGFTCYSIYVGIKKLKQLNREQ
jgi:hypothetical protein